MLPIKDNNKAGPGNQFPERYRRSVSNRSTVAVPPSASPLPLPLPRSRSHTQLVFPEEQHQHAKMEGEHEKNFFQEQNEGHSQRQPEADYLHDEVRSLTASMGYMCVGQGGGVGYGRTNIDKSGGRAMMMSMSHHNQLYNNVSVVDLNEDDSEFVSTSSSSFSSASSFATTSPSPSSNCRCRCSCVSTSSSGMGIANVGGISGGGDISPVSMELKEILDEKLTVFYRFCSETKGVIKDYQVRYEELPIHCRFEDLSSLNYNLEKVKAFRKELDENLSDRLERSRLEMETMLRYSELLMPSEELRITREMEEMGQLFINLYQDIGFEIEGLENFSVAYQNLQDCLQERVSRFSAIKTRLVQVERNLVKDEGGLSLRLKGMQSILSVLERDHDSSENSEISRLLAGIRLYDYVDTRRVLSQTRDLIQQERSLLNEVKQKRETLLEAKDSYRSFMGRIEKFQIWYNDYMRRLSETKATGPDFDKEYPTLVSQREEKRKEFIDILASARNLRASIFDSSAVDEKIETLQIQWKVLVEWVYRVRSRKTI